MGGSAAQGALDTSSGVAARDRAPVTLLELTPALRGVTRLLELTPALRGVTRLGLVLMTLRGAGLGSRRATVTGGDHQLLRHAEIEA